MTDAPRPKGLLLDFGQVCLLSAVELHPATERRLGLEPGTLRWLGPVDPSTDELYRRMTEGELTEREYWHRRAVEVGALAGRPDWTTRDYMTFVFEGDEEDIVRPAARALVDDAKAAGLRTGVLTNDMTAFHGQGFVDRIRLVHDVDVFVDAGQVGFLKPHPRPFEVAIEELGLPAARILFVDDQPANVRGAEDVGLEGFFFDLTRVDDCFRQIRRRLGLEVP